MRMNMVNTDRDMDRDTDASEGEARRAGGKSGDHGSATKQVRN